MRETHVGGVKPKLNCNLTVWWGIRRKKKKEKTTDQLETPVVYGCKKKKKKKKQEIKSEDTHSFLKICQFCFC